MLGISGGVVCAELLDKKGSNAVPLCSPFSPSFPYSFSLLSLPPTLFNWLFSLPLFASFGCPLFSTFSFCHEGNTSKRKAENCSSLKLHLTSKKECSKCEISFSYPRLPFTCLECRPKPEVMSDKCANATSAGTSSLCLPVCAPVCVCVCGFRPGQDIFLDVYLVCERAAQTSYSL